MNERSSKRDPSGPWLTLPVGLFADACRRLKAESDIDRTIGYILLDVATETLLRTYLSLPSEVTGAAGKFEDRMKVAQSNSFRNLLKGVQNASHGVFEHKLLEQVQHYHNIRNKLYHDGTGITVNRQSAEEYAHLVEGLFDLLFGFTLGKTDQAASATDVEGQLWAKVDALSDAIAKEYQRLMRVSRAALEAVQPRLLLPSLEARIDSIAASQTVEELRTMIAGLQIALGIDSDANQVSDDPRLSPAARMAAAYSIRIAVPTMSDGVLSISAFEIAWGLEVAYPTILGKILDPSKDWEKGLSLGMEYGRDSLLRAYEGNVSEDRLNQYVSEGKALIEMIQDLCARISSRWCPPGRE